MVNERQMNIRKKQKNFENNETMGAFVDITFSIDRELHTEDDTLTFDTSIHYIDKGQGETILLVHGIGQSMYTWRNSIDFFVSNGYRVIAIDLAGFGYSAHPHIYYTIEENALIIKAFLDALGIKKTHIAAFSTGALCAICCAASHADNVGKLILISPGGPNENYPFALRFLTTRLGQFLFRMFFSEMMMRNLLHELYFDTTLITDEVVAQYFAPYHNKEVRETLVMSMTHFDDTYARSMLKSIRHKTLVFSGIDDKIHGEKMIRTYIAALPSVKSIRLRNCAHYVHEEKPTRFNEEALAFLKKSDIK